MCIGTRLFRWIWIVAVALMLVWGFTDVRRRADVDPQNIGRHQTDFTVYTEAGAAFFDGRNPYLVTNPRGWYYLYPPLFALLVAPLHGLPPSWQGITWFLLNLLMIAGCIFECRKIAQRLQGPPEAEHQADCRTFPAWIAGAAAVAVLFPLLDTLQRGQVGIAVLLPLLLGFRIISEGQGTLPWILGGSLLALPVAMKITPALPISILLLQQFAAMVRAERSPISVRRFWHCLSGFTLGLVFFFLLLPTMLIGWNDNLRHLETWYTEVVANERLGESKNFTPESIRNQSLGNALDLLDKQVANSFTDATPAAPPIHPTTDKPIARTILMLTRALLVLVLIAVAVRWHWDSGDTGRTAVFGLACAVSLPFSPISWGHHFVMLLPGMLFLPWALSDANRSAAKWLAILPAALSFGHYTTLELASGIAGRLGLFGIGIAIWCIIAGLHLLRLKPGQAPGALLTP
ncbi:MAG: glycosyltransferase family 87 protein [Nitrospiraceae bacterium]